MQIIEFLCLDENKSIQKTLNSIVYDQKVAKNLVNGKPFMKRVGGQLQQDFTYVEVEPGQVALCGLIIMIMVFKT